jgi:hypothetical protein
VLAAMIALGGIFIGKVMVVAWVSIPALEKKIQAAQVKEETSIKFQYETMVECELEKMIANRKLDTDEMSEDELTKLQHEAEDRVKKWGEEKIRAEFTKWKAAQPPSPGLTSLGSVPTGIIAILWTVFTIGIFDFFLVVLSGGAAFLVGGGYGFTGPGRR